MQHIGRYKLISTLAQGGMAQVYRAYDPYFEREVAIKVIAAHYLYDEQFHLRFQREAKVIATLEHPAIVPVYDYGEHKDEPYLVMRLMKNGSLSDRIAKGPISLEDTIQILRRLAPALDMAHSRGIIHRDLKPDNILFDQMEHAYITDFGIAKLLYATTNNLSQSGVVIGTPFYMSPEQALGNKNMDGRSDIYSLGVILFEMLTGVRPFRSDTPAGIIYQHLHEPVPNILAIKPELPHGVDFVVKKAMEKNREARFSTANEMATSLQTAYRSVQIPRKPNIPHRTLGIILGSLLFMVLTVALILTSLSGVGALQSTPTITTDDGNAVVILPSRTTMPEGNYLLVTVNPHPSTTATVIPNATSTIHNTATIVAPSIERRETATLGNPVTTPTSLIPTPSFFDSVSDLIGTNVAPVTVENLSKLSQIATLSGHESAIRSLRFSPNSDYLASASWDGTIRLWRSINHEGEVITAHPSGVEAIAFNSTGQSLASGSMAPPTRVADGAEVTPISFDPVVKVWSTASEELVTFFEGGDKWITSLDFNPSNEAIVAVGSWDKTVQVWNIDTEEKVATLPGDRRVINSVQFNPDGNILAVSSGEDVTLWDWHSQTKLHVLSGHNSWVQSIAISPNGEVLAAGSHQELKLWSIESGLLIETLVIQGGPGALLFTPDGSMLIVGFTFSDTLLLWDTSTWELITRYEIPDVTSDSWLSSNIAITKGGELIAAGTFDGEVKILGILQQ